MFEIGAPFVVASILAFICLAACSAIALSYQKEIRDARRSMRSIDVNGYTVAIFIVFLMVFAILAVTIVLDIGSKL